MQPLDRYPHKFDRGEQREIWADSRERRYPIELWETPKLITPNNRFPVLFYPKMHPGSGGPADLFILVNGFDEGSHHLWYYFGKSFSMARLLKGVSSNGAASALLPIPFHHMRRPVKRPYHNLTSKMMIIFSPIRLYLGFEQLVCDFRMLVAPSSRERSSFDPYIGDEVRLHTIGYSLGGWAVLAAFLRDNEEGEGRIKTCHLLASGVNVPNIGFEALKLPDFTNDVEGAPLTSIEDRIRDYYLAEQGAWRADLHGLMGKGPADRERIADLFEYLVLGYRDDEKYAPVATIWKDCAPRIHHVLLADDLVMPPDRVAKCCPEGALRNRTTIEGVGHQLERPWMRHGAEQAMGAIWAFASSKRSDAAGGA